MNCIDMCWYGTVFKVLHKKKIKQDADMCALYSNMWTGMYAATHIHSHLCLFMFGP